MPRQKKSSIKVEGNTISGTVEDLTGAMKKLSARLSNDGKHPEPEAEKEFKIKEGHLKDRFCNYSYEVMTGITAGDKCDRTGANIVHDDLAKAFKKLHPHIGVIAEIVMPADFKGTDIDSIEDYNEDEHKDDGIEHIISRYSVSGFKVEGRGENESVVLIGTKILSTGDILKITTPKRTWHSDYAFMDELRAAIDECRREVYQYMEGKEAPKLVQQSLDIPDAPDTEIQDADFE